MELAISTDTLCGFLARFVVEQHPFNSTDGIMSVNAAIRAAGRLMKDQEGWTVLESGWACGTWKSWREVEDWLKGVIYEHPQMAVWNHPADNNDLPFGVSSRFDQAKPDTDFIDIDALVRNVALYAWREAENELNVLPELQAS